MSNFEGFGFGRFMSEKEVLQKREMCSGGEMFYETNAGMRKVEKAVV